MMKTNQSKLIAIAISGIVPAIYAQESKEKVGPPNHPQVETKSTDSVETKQPTGERVMDKAGAPSQVVPGTKAEKVDSTDSIGTMVSKTESFSMLAKALEAAELTDTLNDTGPFTLLAPNDDAFKKLPEGTWEEWTKPENKAALRAVLMNHVIAGSMSSDAFQEAPVTTNSGAEVMVTRDGEKLMVGDATVITPDLVAKNGTVHVVDTVVIPENE